MQYENFNKRFEVHYLVKIGLCDFIAFFTFLNIMHLHTLYWVGGDSYRANLTRYGITYSSVFIVSIICALFYTAYKFPRRKKELVDARNASLINLNGFKI